MPFNILQYYRVNNKHGGCKEWAQAGYSRRYFVLSTGILPIITNHLDITEKLLIVM